MKKNLNRIGLKIVAIFVFIATAGCAKNDNLNDESSPIKKYPITIEFERFNTKVIPLGVKEIHLLSSTMDRDAIMQEGYRNFDLVVYDKDNNVVAKEYLGYYYNFKDFKLELPKGQYTSFISISKPVYSADGDRLQIDQNNRVFLDYGHQQSKDVLIGKSELTVSESNNRMQYSLFRPGAILSLDIEDLDKLNSSVMGIKLRFKKPGSIRMDDFAINQSNMIDSFTEIIRFSNSGSQAYIRNFYTPYLVTDEATIQGMQIDLIKTSGSSAGGGVLKTFDVPTFKVYRNKQTTITGRLFDEDQSNNQNMSFYFTVSEPTLIEEKVNFN